MRLSRRSLTVAATAVVLLAIGALVADGVDGALGISTAPASAPVEHPAVAPAHSMVAPPRWVAVSVPADKRVTLAADAVAAALAGRGLLRPTVQPAGSGSAGSGSAGTGPAGSGSVGSGSTGTAPAGATLRVVLVASLPGSPPPGPPPTGSPLPGSPPTGSPSPGAALPASDEAFRIRSDGRGGGLVLEASSVAGAASGLYTVADRIRSGESVLPAGDDGRVVVPRLGLRMTDLGSVGLDPDPARFAAGTDYNLNTDVVSSAILPRAPWVDQHAVAAISAQYRQFVDHALVEGYNALTLPGFLEYVTFAGTGVYPAGDPHVARARAMVAAFGPVWRYAHDMGMKVYVKTDMLALSPPLKAYLTATAGMDLTSPKLWSVYQDGIRELYAAMPFLDGIMLRVGEGGSDYRLAGWDYYSEIDVTTVPAVQAMLRAFLRVADQTGIDVIFRTWSVSLGDVGDMHTDPDTFAKVLDGIDDEHLIVSTKYVAGDYYSYLPLNPTLTVGRQRRIIEFQARREFEGFGSLPNDLGDLEQQALRTLLAANPNIIGVWVWTQDGGPLLAGPRTLYLRAGFWQLWDLDVYLTSRLARDPDTDTGQATGDWIRQTLSTDPGTVDALSRAFALSRQAVTDGLYIGPFASRSVKALGLRPPPMMWIFEWDIVTGDTATLDSIYAVSRDQVDQAIAQGDRAVATARQMQALIDGTGAATWATPALRQSMMDTAAYQVNLFQTLGAYRTMVLRHARWLDSGSAADQRAWLAARAAYQKAREEHLRRYAGDVDLPAYNFAAADLGLARDDRDQTMAWLARVLLALLLAALAAGGLASRAAGRAGTGATRGRWSTWPGMAALRALWIGATQPWRVAGIESPSVSPARSWSRLDRVLVWLIPAAVLAGSRAIYAWFAAPAHLILVLGGWLLFALALRLLIGRADPFRLWAAVGGAAMLRTVILLVALVSRGPGRYWYLFWTAPTSRSVYITVAFAAFGWVFVVAFLALHDGYGLVRRRAMGRVVAATGVVLAVLGGLVAAIGLERALTIWNDQLALLPWGLARILGITVYLGIPASIPDYVSVAGAVLVAAGLALGWQGRRRAAGRDRRQGPPANRSALGCRPGRARCRALRCNSVLRRPRRSAVHWDGRPGVSPRTTTSAAEAWR
ncbi:hypothetical protein [Rugosimonospora africana]|uniref:Glycosyl hydrolase family 67 C-terminus n=1 Tax=Rugosimonospora africana TaxID=556532 RepID=A0A8J3QNG0_9ACTN|nr:hypothetical protein [Rugosimonospora africana]GIH14325.1 hypothetical protein Raf01_24970 [Rugosimonospora africana]